MTYKKYLVVALLLLSQQKVFSQKGIFLDFSSSFTFPFAESNLEGSRPLGQESVDIAISPNGSYGAGYLVNFNIGYNINNILGVGLGYSKLLPVTEQTFYVENNSPAYSFIRPNMTSSYKGSLSFFNPFVSLSKKVETKLGKIITPVIKFGLVIAKADVEVVRFEDNSNHQIQTTTKYDVGNAYGFSTAIGFKTTVSKHWKMFAEVNATGMNYKPKSATVYSVDNGVSGTQKIEFSDDAEATLSSRPSVSFPFSSYGIRVGIVFTFNKVDFFDNL